MTQNVVINITILNSNGITFSPTALMGTYEDEVISTINLTNNSGNSIPVGTEFTFSGTIGTNDNLIISILVSGSPIPDNQTVSVDVRLTGEISNAITAEDIINAITAEDIDFIPIVNMPPS